MAGARLLLGRRDDPDIIGKTGGNSLKHSKAGRVNSVVIGKQDAHCCPMPARQGTHKLRFSRNKGALFGTVDESVIVKPTWLNYRPLGDIGFLT
jgi:hypothetical protein